MFEIRIRYEKNSDTYAIGNKCNNCDKVRGHKLHNEKLNEDINTFVLHVVIQHVVMSWIIDNNKHIKFDIYQKCSKWMQTFPWYHTTIIYQLIGHKFEDYFTAGCKARYELLCAADAHDIMQQSGPDDASISGGR